MFKIEDAQLKAPRLNVDLEKLRENTAAVAGWCRAAGLELLAVTKGLRGDPRAAEAFLSGGAIGLADSRLSNLRRMQHLRPGRAEQGSMPFLLLRAPAPTQAAEAAVLSDRVLCAGMLTAKKLAQTMPRGRAFEVYLTVDFGDLREGLLPEEVPGAAVALERALAEATGESDPLRRTHIAGLASNMACFCGVVPTLNHLERLSDMAARAGRSLGRRLRVSAGNTATLPLVLGGSLPGGLDELRVGEGILLGRESLHREPLPGCHLDALTFTAAVIETGVKPSAPVGELAEDAFGHRAEYVDRGRRCRAILGAGRQDIVPEGLKPLEEGIEVIGATSDHLVLDIEDYAGHLEVGYELTFTVNYACLLQAATSPDVIRVYSGGGRQVPPGPDIGDTSR